MSELTETGINENAAGGIAYVTCIPAIVFLLIDPYKNKPYVRFHSFQSIFLCISWFVFSVALAFVLVFGSVLGFHIYGFVTRIFWMVWIIVWVLCAVSALNGKYFKLPIIGPIADRLANK